MTKVKENTALDHFLANKAEIDVRIKRLQSLSDNNFNLTPEISYSIHWGHVNQLRDYAELLKQITDSAFNESEYTE